MTTPGGHWQAGGIVQRLTWDSGLPAVDVVAVERPHTEVVA